MERITKGKETGPPFSRARASATVPDIHRKPLDAISSFA
jgi:hypothetical protein